MFSAAVFLQVVGSHCQNPKHHAGCVLTPRGLVHHATQHVGGTLLFVCVLESRVLELQKDRAVEVTSLRFQALAGAAAAVL